MIKTKEVVDVRDIIKARNKLTSIFSKEMERYKSGKMSDKEYDNILPEDILDWVICKIEDTLEVGE